MNQSRIQHLARTVGTLPSRRDLLRGIASTGIGLGIAQGADSVEARKRRKGRKRTGKKARPNSFGCLELGDSCGSAADCCSGICEGQKGKRRCGAHDTGNCAAGTLGVGCGGSASVPCVTARGEAGECATTTGNAGYCRASFYDYSCQTDIDCQTVDDGRLGPRAACVRCGDNIRGLCAEPAGSPS